MRDENEDYFVKVGVLHPCRFSLFEPLLKLRFRRQFLIALMQPK